MTTLRTDGGYTPTPDDTPWHRLGGSAAIQALVEAFYDDMEVHEPALAAVHQQEPPGAETARREAEGRGRSDPSSPGKISRRSRERFGLFLVGWLGGPQDYTEQHGHPRLRMRHARVEVGVEFRDAWLRSMTRAMDARKVEGPVREYLNTRFGEVADFLRNVPAP